MNERKFFVALPTGKPGVIKFHGMGSTTLDGARLRRNTSGYKQSDTGIYEKLPGEPAKFIEGTYLGGDRA